ncbi:MAG TPA: DUF4173 domain-containing protein [Pyrinomonadaceae bacterium]|jgi:hypothetical protein|nr:DUF4173 domain-containing protein [Pyrinomonadaceae bacterium]
MNERTKKGLEIVQTAFILGILGDTLLRAMPWGLNFFLWVTALAVGLWVVTVRYRNEKPRMNSLLLHGALIFLAVMFVWRDAVQLLVFDVLAILMVLAVLTLPAMKLQMQQSGLAHYALGWVYSGFNCAFSPFLLIVKDIKFKGIPRNGATKHLAAALRGILVATPILLIFGALFVAADAAFQDLIEKTFRIDFEFVIGHLVTISALSWVVAGYLRGATFFIFDREAKESANDLSISPDELDLKEKTDKAEKPKTWDLQDINNSFFPSYFTFGTVELSVVLGLMNLLFLAFVIVQVPYLFGGMDLVQNTENLKLAEYARRGFGELVFVSALVLPVLMAAQWLIRKDDKMAIAVYRVLACVQISLLFVIMLSAAQRMLLYTGTSGYGLTTMRFYPMVFMIWMAVVFVWFAATVLRGKRQQFAWGTLWSALLFLGVLHVFNPDHFIARTNIGLMHAGRNFDASYMRDLSDDAVPALLEGISAFNAEQRCMVQKNLVKRIEKYDKEADLRSWNWSRWNARLQLSNAATGFDISGCAEGAEREQSEIKVFDREL